MSWCPHAHEINHAKLQLFTCFELHLVLRDDGGLVVLADGAAAEDGSATHGVQQVDLRRQINILKEGIMQLI